MSIRQGNQWPDRPGNGAGKTTFFNTQLGSLHAGWRRLRLRRFALVRRCAARQPNGIARHFQNIRLFGNMTALRTSPGRHVRTAAGCPAPCSRMPRPRSGGSGHPPARARDLLHYAYRGPGPTTWPESIPAGDQRRLEIARALATDPGMLCLDEPAAGNECHRNRRVARHVDGIRRDGTTILLIEHDVKLVMGLCDRVAVLDYGAR